ncbi:MAG: hypothetical protein ACRC1K_13945, partial [Planctomycetia bacterium]
MRLWTVQPVAVWEQIRNAAAAWVEPTLVNSDGWSPPAYSWLVWRMRGRIGDSCGRPPWFAYCERPDLRLIRHTRPKGVRQVLIEFEPPAGASLDFPSWAWNDVYCGQYLSFTGAEDRAWRTRLRATVGISFDRLDEAPPSPFQEE